MIDEYGGFAGIAHNRGHRRGTGRGDRRRTRHPTRRRRHRSRRTTAGCFRGDLHLDEVERTLGHQFPAGDYDTVAGMVIAHAGGLPNVGDTVEIPLDPATAPSCSARRPPARRTVGRRVRAIERRVPASVFVTMRTDPDARR